jgi:hypothetical protein
MESVQTNIHQKILLVGMPWENKGTSHAPPGSSNSANNKRGCKNQILTEGRMSPKERLVRQIYSRTKNKTKERRFRKADHAKLIKIKTFDDAQSTWADLTRGEYSNYQMGTSIQSSGKSANTENEMQNGWLEQQMSMRISRVRKL